MSVFFVGILGTFADSFVDNLQDRRASFAIQIRSSPETLQAPPFSPPMGPSPRSHLARFVVAPRNVRRNQNLHLEPQASAGDHLFARYLARAG